MPVGIAITGANENCFSWAFAFEKNKTNELKHYYLLGSGFSLWLIWQLFTLIGIFLGSIVPEERALA